MFRRIEDFLDMWKHETTFSLKLMDAIPDTALGQAVSSEHRDLRRLAWHITESAVEMPSGLGIQVAAFPGEPYKTAPPATMKEIRDTYASVAADVAAGAARLNAMALAMTYPFYGMTWTGAFALQVCLLHQAHHRGQMTVLMRQAGLAVPGTFGPSKEEWGGWGMPAPEV